MCFVWIWEQTAIMSLHSINWLVFITEADCVYSAVRTGSLNIIQVYIKIHVLPTHTVFMCFVWIWEQTAIISLHSINWSVFVTETDCVYSAVRTGSLNIIQVYVKIYVLPTQCISVFYRDLRTNSDYFPIHH